VDNWKLYPDALKELGRVCKPHTGRAVLLTYDTKVMAHVSLYIILCFTIANHFFVGVEYKSSVEEKVDIMD